MKGVRFWWGERLSCRSPAKADTREPIGKSNFDRLVSSLAPPGQGNYIGSNQFEVGAVFCIRATSARANGSVSALPVVK